MGQFSAPTLLAPSITLPFRLLFSLLWTFNSCILDSCHQSPTQSMAPILWQRTIFNSTKVIHSVSPLGNVSKGQKHLWACNKRETITTTTHGYLGCTWMVTKAGVAQESLHPLRNENGDPALHPLWQQPLERHRDNPFTSSPSLSPPTQEKKNVDHLCGSLHDPGKISNYSLWSDVCEWQKIPDWSAPSHQLQDGGEDRSARN